MLWGHTNCPIVEGWQSRLRTKFAMAGKRNEGFDIAMQAQVSTHSALSCRRRGHICGCCPGGAAAATFPAPLSRNHCELHALRRGFCRCVPNREAGQADLLLPPNPLHYCAVCQETCRLMRCEDSAANSAIAGAATAALLLNLQSIHIAPKHTGQFVVL